MSNKPSKPWRPWPLKRLGRKRTSSTDQREDDEGERNGGEYGSLLRAVDIHHAASSPSHNRRDSMASTTMRGQDSSRRNLYHPTQDKQEFEDNPVVPQLEWILRHVLLVVGAYLLGAYRPEYTHLVRKTSEYLGVAWMTCVVILLLTAWQHWNVSKQQQQTRFVQQEQQADEELSLPTQQQPVIQNGDLQHYEMAETEEPIRNGDTNSLYRDLDLVPTLVEDQDQPHPSLEPFYIVNTNNNMRIIPNTIGQPCLLDSEIMTGQMLVLLRTPNVDNADESPGTRQNVQTSNYFADKQRRFEFQFQVKLKRLPLGRVFFAVELEEPMKLGILQTAFVKAAMAFVKKMNSTFQYNISGTEKPHLAFTVEGSMDRLVVTPSGEQPPTLGGAIHEDPMSIKERKRGGGAVEWNTTDTFTFCLWSAYTDFLEWRVMNLPGIKPFQLSSVMGSQPLGLLLYEVDAATQERNHLVHFELSNTNHSEPGPACRIWAKEHNSRQLFESGGASMDEEDEFEHARDFLSDDDEEEDAIDDEAAELGQGLYLRSGDAIVLRESLVETALGDIVTIGGGFAILQERSSSVVVIEKATRRSRRRRPSMQENMSAAASSELIRSGDTVMLKLVSTNKDKIETKYLSIHRGWWLKWVNTAPQRNGYFSIHTNEVEVSNGQPLEDTQSSFLTLGGAFTLRHKRWAGYEVGVSVEESPTYGGHMLGLYKPGTSSNHADEEMQNPDDEEYGDMDESGTAEKRENKWMRPLRLSANVESALATPSKYQLDAPSFTFEDNGETLLGDNFQVDVPVWIEMMNRSQRRRQLAYVVRVVVEGSYDEEVDAESRVDDDGEEANGCTAFVRLRTGTDLAEIMQVGMACKSSEADLAKPKLRYRRSSSAPENNEIHKRLSMADDDELLDNPTSSREFDMVPNELSYSFGQNEDDVDSVEDLEWEEGYSDDGLEYDTDGAPLSPGKKKGKRKIIGKIAKSVKTGTVTTGKHVARSSKKAGKAIVAPIARSRPKRPPDREPKTKRVKTPAKARRRRKEERSHHVVVNRTM